MFAIVSIDINDQIANYENSTIAEGPIFYFVNVKSNIKIITGCVIVVNKTEVCRNPVVL